MFLIILLYKKQIIGKLIYIINKQIYIYNNKKRYRAVMRCHNYKSSEPAFDTSFFIYVYFIIISGVRRQIWFRNV